jgi:hypothetical protein
LPTDDVPGLVERLTARLGLPVWRGPTEDFAAVGDEHGLLIVVRPGSSSFWTEAAPYPLEIVAQGATTARFEAPDLGYHVRLTKGH